MCYSVLVQNDLEKLSPNFEFDFVDKRTKDLPEFLQIYPGYDTPIIAKTNERMKIDIMRYGIYPPYASKLAPFNARRDNLLSPFWSQSFATNHGIIIMKKFYEWVLVSDLTKDSKMLTHEIEQYFSKQREEKEKRCLELGKKFVPSKSDLLPIEQKKIVIEFFEQNKNHMFVPVVYSFNKNGLLGCALITDEPRPEVLATGHDRTPVILEEETAIEWLKTKNKSKNSHLDLLKHTKELVLNHQIAFN